MVDLVKMQDYWNSVDMLALREALNLICIFSVSNRLSFLTAEEFTLN